MARDFPRFSQCQISFTPVLIDLDFHGFAPVVPRGFSYGHLGHGLYRFQALGQVFFLRA